MLEYSSVLEAFEAFKSYSWVMRYFPSSSIKSPGVPSTHPNLQVRGCSFGTIRRSWSTSEVQALFNYLYHHVTVRELYVLPGGGLGPVIIFSVFGRASTDPSIRTAEEDRMGFMVWRVKTMFKLLKWRANNAL
jgi:hypothetical protein